MKTITEATQILLSCLPDDIRVLSDLFTKNNKELFLVGGCVRDSFLGKEPKDFDVCTNALPDTIMEILSSANIKCELRGVDFGVVVAKMSEEIEIATFRADISANTGNNKDTKVVLGVSIEDDVMRRDLTINGLFMNLHTNEIIDLVGGVQDLNDKVVRCIGKPEERFAEDDGRKLRVIRFASTLGFDIDKDTFDAIKNNSTLVKSREMIVKEFTKAVEKSQDSFELLTNVKFSGLLPEILKEVKLRRFPAIVESFDFSETLNTFIAKCVDPSEADTIADKLLALGFSSKTCSSVELLLTLETTTMKPMAFVKKMPSTDLTTDEITDFFVEFGIKTKEIAFLTGFKVDKQLTQDLLAQGFKGKDLGDKIDEITMQQMQTFLK